MLDFARVRHEAGDEFGRFFRRVDEHGVELREADGHRVEAYHWGKFTSGSWSQALWLLIAPFGVVNAAQFTLEPPTSAFSRFCHTMAGASLRLIGLVLTGLFVLGAAVITVDLWSWQLIGFGETFPQRFVPALALLGPVAVVVLLRVFGRARLARANSELGGNPYELKDSTDESKQGKHWSETAAKFWDAKPPTNLTRPGFFPRPGKSVEDTEAPALRGFHVGAGLGVVALLGFAPARQAGADLGQVGFLASFAVLAAVLLAVVLIGDPTDSASIDYQSARLIMLKKRVRSLAPRVSLFLAVMAGLLAVTAIAYTAAQRFPHSRGGAYPELDHVAYVIMALAVIGMIVLFLANLGLAIAERKSPARERLHRRFGPFAKGMACTLISSTGVFLAVGYVGAFGLTAATFFDSDKHPVVAPELLKRVVYAWGITAAMFILLAFVALLHRRIRRSGLRERVTADFTEGAAAKRVILPTRWVRRVASAMWAARLKNHLVLLLTLFALVGMGLSVVAAIELSPQWRDKALIELGGWVGALSESEVNESDVSTRQAVVLFLTWLGGLTLTGLATLLLFLGRTAILAESTRRGVNVLWDVIAYWPRSVHPLVPPAYSQRSVADIRGRIAWHLGTLAEGTPEANPAPTDRLVLCGHSQGSLLSFSALVTMGGTPELGKVGLLTFGSQLQVMFSRAFPAYVNYPTISWLYAALGGRWRNLYRETDHLAGPVLSWNHRSVPSGRGGRVKGPTLEEGRAGLAPPSDVAPCPGDRRQYGADWRLLDPPCADYLLQQHALLSLRRHSDYWKDAAWADAVIEVLPHGGGDGAAEDGQDRVP